jgi:co-chaperonin GroES (HSP10)
MNPIDGKLLPLNDNILVKDMNFDEQKTAGGIILRSDDGKVHGVKPRWCCVWAIGPDQKDVRVGEWILVEHGRWTRGFTVKDENGSTINVRRVDPAGVMISADEKPNDVYIGDEAMLAPSQTVRPEDFI